MTSVSTVEVQTPLPPIVLKQQKAINAALALAADWDEQAARLQAVAKYTHVHGTSSVADRYAMRGHVLSRVASSLREALSTPEGDS